MRMRKINANKDIALILTSYEVEALCEDLRALADWYGGSGSFALDLPALAQLHKTSEEKP